LRETKQALTEQQNGLKKTKMIRNPHGASKAESIPLLRREWPIRTRALGVYSAGHAHSIATMGVFNRTVLSIEVFH
jgi:hypothetical protein